MTVATPERFHAVLRELGELHDRKQRDYGRTGDPFSNVRASEDWGIEGWIGAMVRLNDKVRRLQVAAQGGTLANEGVIDSLRDIAVYSIIAEVLYREAHGDGGRATGRDGDHSPGEWVDLTRGSLTEKAAGS